MKAGTKLGIVALVLAIGCAAFWNHQTRQVDIPENRIAFVAVFVTAVFLGVAAFFRGAGWLGRIAAVLAICIGSLVPLTMAVSRQDPAANAIRVGDTIPAFSAPDDRGELFDSERLRGHPVLIKFFRAHW